MKNKILFLLPTLLLSLISVGSAVQNIYAQSTVTYSCVNTAPDPEDFNLVCTNERTGAQVPVTVSGSTIQKIGTTNVSQCTQLSATGGGGRYSCPPPTSSGGGSGAGAGGIGSSGGSTWACERFGIGCDDDSPGSGVDDGDDSPGSGVGGRDDSPGSPWFDDNDNVDSPGNCGGSSGGGLQNPLKFCSIEEFFLALIDILLIFAVPIIIFFIIYAGFMYVTAQGDAAKVSKATRALTYAVVGGLLILGARALIAILENTVDQFRS